MKASLPFGSFLFYKFSFLKILILLAFPILFIEKSLPYGDIMLFLILFAGLVRNPKVPSFVRYNACQALLLDIMLIIFNHALRIFPLNELNLFLFIAFISIFIFSTIQCICGIEPEIPFISKSVRMQIY